jgi:hypothetical protein
VAPQNPDRMIYVAPDMEVEQCYEAAQLAVAHAQALCPKLTGTGASGIRPIFGEGYFGLTWTMPYIWVQNTGAKPFLMRSLAGKTIPMWVDDPIGTTIRDNPKAKTRTTASGRTQVLIFRKAAPIGSRKTVKRKGPGGATISVDVPRSYPGAAGRIAQREAAAPYTTPGKLGGRVAAGNIGIRWYFPGLSPRSFLEEGLQRAASHMGARGHISVAYDFLPDIDT